MGTEPETEAGLLYRLAVGEVLGAFQGYAVELKRTPLDEIPLEWLKRSRRLFELARHQARGERDRLDVEIARREGTTTTTWRKS